MEYHVFEHETQFIRSPNFLYLVNKNGIKPVCICFLGYYLFLDTHSLKLVHYFSNVDFSRTIDCAFIAGSTDPWRNTQQYFMFHALTYHGKNLTGWIIHYIK